MKGNFKGQSPSKRLGLSGRELERLRRHLVPSPQPRARRLEPAVDPSELLETLVARGGSHAQVTLLDSGGPCGKNARWKILAAMPLASLSSTGRQIRLRDAEGHQVYEGDGDALEWLGTMAKWLGPPPRAFPGPMAGGLVFSLAHEWFRLQEPSVESHAPDGADLSARLYGVVLAYDRQTQQSYLYEWRPGASKPLAREFTSKRGQPKPTGDPPLRPTGMTANLRRLPETLRSSFSSPAYQDSVERIRTAIRAGEAYEVNLTQRLSIPEPRSLPTLYRRLRELSPAPFAAYADLPDRTILSSSPERFLLHRAGVLESRPIKGSRPRSRDPREDKALARALLESPKDRAENVMICDLVRNDLGRIATSGSVVVRALCELESHPGLHHLVSTVEARLAPNRTPTDALRAAFPPGSMTGAPKIRACQLIHELEPVARGAYAGAIGYLDPRGNLDTSVLIRAFVSTPHATTLGVGGAVTWDSCPLDEYNESLDKARLPLEAAGLWGKFPDRSQPWATSSGRTHQRSAKEPAPR